MTNINERAAEVIAQHAKDIPQEVLKLLFEMMHELTVLQVQRAPAPVFLPPVEAQRPIPWERPNIGETVVMYGAAPSWPDGHGGRTITTSDIALGTEDK